MAVSSHRHQGLLGTVIDVSVRASTAETADEADAAIVTEVERLQRIFDRFDPTSDLERWRRGEKAPSPELDDVLHLAGRWRDRTRGAFDPTIGPLYAVWDAAERCGRLPTDDELAAARPASKPGGEGLDPTDPDVVAAIDLNALAKGWIVDRAVDRALRLAGVIEVVVNAGGDLRHRGTGLLRVGIENPLRPYDNEPPILRIAVSEAAVATSGIARRQWRIGGRRYSRVLDPRTGRPSTGPVSTTVVADDAGTADVLATAFTVLGPDESATLADDLEVAICSVGEGGAVLTNPRFDRLRLS